MKRRSRAKGSEEKPPQEISLQGESVVSHEVVPLQPVPLDKKELQNRSGNGSSRLERG